MEALVEKMGHPAAAAKRAGAGVGAEGDGVASCCTGDVVAVAVAMAVMVVLVQCTDGPEADAHGPAVNERGGSPVNKHK